MEDVIDIRLGVHQSFAWFHDEAQKVYVRGYLFGRGKYYEGESLLTYFIGCTSIETFRAYLEEANGHFAVWMLREGGEVWGAVDVIRSIPLFYAYIDNRWCITDSPNTLADKDANLSYNQAEIPAYLHACYTLGEASLYKEVKQIQAGEYVVLCQEGATTDIYYPHFAKQYHEINVGQVYVEFGEIWERAFKRFIHSLKGRTVVIPLSGGYDSRGIVAALKRARYEKVICFTYGQKGSFEVVISKQVAERLGYKWYYVPYTANLLASYTTEEGIGYRDYAANMASVAHEQDYFAVKYLKDEGLIPTDALFVPGFGGDVLGGSWLSKGLKVEQQRYTWQEVLEEIALSPKFFGGSSRMYTKTGYLKQCIEKELLPVKFGEEGSFDDFYRMFQHWGMRNRMAKFLVNAVRVYEYLGYEWRLPLLDRELMQFCYRLPISLRLNKHMYLTYLHKKLFVPYNLVFESPENTPNPIKQWIKRFIPSFVWASLKRSLPTNADWDVNNQTALSKHLCQYLTEGEDLMRHHDLNFIMAKWYIQDHFGIDLEQIK